MLERHIVNHWLQDKLLLLTELALTLEEPIRHYLLV
jgi:hypothetical protein